LNEAQFFNTEDMGYTLVPCSLSQDIPLKQNTKEGCFMIAGEYDSRGTRNDTVYFRHKKPLAHDSEGSENQIIVIRKEKFFIILCL